MNQGMLNFKEERKVLSVSDLNRQVKNFLRKEFGSVWVSGEVSRPTYHSSGHLYFSLKDKNAQVSVACFRPHASRLRFKLEQGMEVVLYASVSIFEPRGDYQLVAEKIEPRGVGALQIAFEQLKEKLNEEGLFDESRKKPTPFLPARIGVITSPTGAAVRDILNVSLRRFPNAHITIFPVSVQGETAASEIAEAIKIFNTEPSLNDVEVLIVGRGGGSIEDLWCFNEEIVARAIYKSRIPVISAVGHEIDFTISDFFADRRAPTPSAAAELAFPEKRDVENNLENCSRRAGLALKNRMEKNKMSLSEIKRSFVFRHFIERLNERSQHADELARQMNRACSVLMTRSKEKITAAAARLETLSPLKVLGRGYSVTTNENGNIIRSVGDVHKKNTIHTRLKDGIISSEVSRVAKNE